MSTHVIPRSTTTLLASPVEAEALSSLLSEGETAFSDGPLPATMPECLLKLKLLLEPKTQKSPRL